MKRIHTSMALLGLVCSCSSGSSPAASMPSIAFDLAATVSASRERYVCELVQLPEAPAEVFVNGGSYAASSGVHHYLLFRTSFTKPPPDLGRPIDCFEGEGVMRYERGFVSGGAKLHDAAHFPEGLALPFHGGDVLLLQAHLLDAGASALDVKLHVELDTVRASEVTARVGTLRFYDPYIVVPAHATATARMRCPLEHDVTLVSAGSHMHRRGASYRAFADLPGAPPAAVAFYTTTDWQSPPYWYGPLGLTAGSHLRFECDYRSQDDVDVVQGLSADTNEMCMFSAFYAPASDDPAQQRREEDCVAMDQLGTGDRSCAETTSCLDLCAPGDAPSFDTGDPTVGACWQRCIVDSCPNASAALLPQLECAGAQCAAECASFGATCSQCVESRCKAQLDACQALACADGAGP